MSAIWRTLGLALVLLARLSSAAPSAHDVSLHARQATDKLVFCHFMVEICLFEDAIEHIADFLQYQIGVVSDRTSANDFDNDMITAKKAGIDAFALNIGVDDFTKDVLGYAYASAAKNGMSVFISFDFNWYRPEQASNVASMLANFVSEQAQLKVGGKAFVSTFQGDGLDINMVRNTVKSLKGIDLFVVPNFKAGNLGGADGLFNWMAWPNDGDNKAPKGGNNVTVRQGDEVYKSTLDSKPYMARKS